MPGKGGQHDRCGGENTQSRDWDKEIVKKRINDHRLPLRRVLCKKDISRSSVDA